MKQYPAGRVCGMPGCDTILRRTHEGPICDPCTDNAKARLRAMDSGPPTSADSAAVAEAAPGARAKKRGRQMPTSSERAAACVKLDARVLECLSDGVAVSGTGIGKALGISRDRVQTSVEQLRAAGQHIVSERGMGHMLMSAAVDDKILVDESLPAHSDEGEESAKTAPVGWPAPAPDTSREQSADEAPAPAPETPSEPVPAAGLRPFAGITVVQTECRGLGRELSILDELEGLDEEARERVLAYAFARWPGQLNIREEVRVRYPNADKLAVEILDTLDRFARTAL